MTCTICNSTSDYIFTRKVLNTYDVRYYYCPSCGYLHTDKPFWLAEAYASPIALADTGILKRNLDISRKLSKILYLMFERDSKYVDVAGGYGLMVRLMRDIGFDYYWEDSYTQNIFAKGFEADFSGNNTYDTATAFEVLEHLESPLEYIRTTLNKTGASTLIFTTELYSGPPPRPESWWYFCFETGQHISFYQQRTLEFIAKKLDMNLISHNSLHIISKKKLNSLLFKVATSKRFDRFLQQRIRKKMATKSISDHQHMLSGAH